MTRLIELPHKYQQPPVAKPRKYRNEPTVYNGIRYHSVKEAKFAQSLDLAMHARP